MIQLNEIYNEDCLEGMKKVEDQSIDAIICDLPYGTTACSWDTILPFDLLWWQYQRVIKSKGAIVLFGAEPFSTQLRQSNFKNYKYDWYWTKNTATGFTFAKSQPMRSVEIISVFSYQAHHYYPQGLERVIGSKPVIRKAADEALTAYLPWSDQVKTSCK